MDGLHPLIDHYQIGVDQVGNSLAGGHFALAHQLHLPAEFVGLPDIVLIGQEEVVGPRSKARCIKMAKFPVAPQRRPSRGNTRMRSSRPASSCRISAVESVEPSSRTSRVQSASDWRRMLWICCRRIRGALMGGQDDDDLVHRKVRLPREAPVKFAPSTSGRGDER